jgi:AsmA protein
MKILKLGLLALAALALVFAAVLGYLAFTFDPRQFEPQIVSFVYEKTGRTLRLSGPIALSLWPPVGVQFGPASLSERGSDARFADLARARLNLRMGPLLSGVLVVEDVRIEGAHVTITRFRDGRWNVDDLLKDTGEPLQLEVSRVRVDRSALSFDDQLNGKQYAISDVAIETGRIARRAVSPVVLSFRAVDAAATFDVTARLKSRLTVDVSARRYSFDEAHAELQGRLPGFQELAAQLRARIQSDPESVVISEVAGTLRAQAFGSAVEATYGAERGAIDANGIVGEGVTLRARVLEGSHSTLLELVFPRIAHTARALVAERAHASLDLTRSPLAIKATASAAVEADDELRIVNLSALESRFDVHDQRLPQGRVSGALRGKGALDRVRETAHIALAGEVAGSRVNGSLVFTAIADLRCRFDIGIDVLDLDRFQGRSRSAGSGFDLKSLEGLPASGTLKIGVLRSSGVEARDVEVVLQP